MINLDRITDENNKKYNEKWPYIPDHPYRILIIGCMFLSCHVRVFRVNPHSIVD